MTAVTLKFEDSLLKRLKTKADNIGYSLDNYILYLLTKNSDDLNEATQNQDIDALLDSMQFHDACVPVSENGKGVVSEIKFMY